MKKVKKLPYRILGVSAGNGVVLFPLKQYVIGNIECRSDYYIKGEPLQWGINFNSPMVKSIEEFPYNNLSIDVIIGHPKCGVSSLFALSRGKKFSSHRGEPSLDLYIRAIIKYNPKFFFLENLEGLLNSYPLDELKLLFSDHRILAIKDSVTHFGNSQVTRKRLLLIGIRWDIYNHTIEKILLNHKTIKPKTVKELLQNLPENGHVTEPLDSTITLYSKFKISLKEVQAFWLANPKLRHWPIYNGKMNTAPGVYINRENDYPLTVRKTNRQFNPEGIQMSPRELGRIQGVTDNFLFYISNSLTTTINKGRITVGNTPPMDLGFWILSKLKKIYNFKKA